MFGKKKKPEKIVKKAAQRQADADAAAKVGRHIHNDLGEQKVRGKVLYTYCTCGKLMATDLMDD